MGAAFVPEERLGHAAVPNHRLSENAVLSHHAGGETVRAGFVLFRAARRLARRIVESFDVRAPGGDPAARKLSGGNLQKFVVGREIVRRPKALVVDQPTWGVDAGAARLIRQALVDLAGEGAAVLLISQDLDELFEITDRLTVIHDGRLGPLRADARLDAPGDRARDDGRGGERCPCGLSSRRGPRCRRIARALAPVAALLVAFLVAGLVIALLGRSPVQAFQVYLVGPLTDPWSLRELAVKATPLALIAVGLAYCFRAGLWNIGAEGQFVIGAICGGWLALRTHGTAAGAWVLPAMLLLGALGGALYGLIPAILRVRFGASEILTSLMLVYVAQLTLDYLTRGPWRDPKGFNFPQTVTFEPVRDLALHRGRRARPSRRRLRAPRRARQRRRARPDPVRLPPARHRRGAPRGPLRRLRPRPHDASRLRPLKPRSCWWRARRRSGRRGTSRRRPGPRRCPRRG